MSENTEESKKLKIEIQKNYELERVKHFLRGEVEVLRKQNKELLESTEFIIGNKIKNNFLFRTLIIFKRVKDSINGRKSHAKRDAELSFLDGQADEQKVSSDKVTGIDNKKSQASTAGRTKKEVLDYLFVQLSNNSEIGGIYQLNSIFEEMKRKNLKVASVYINKDFAFSHIGFEADLDLKNTKFDKIIFSGMESFEFIRKLNNVQNAKIINYLQGPDYLFPGNEANLEVFIDSIRSVSAVMTQSPYLDSLAKYLGAKRREQITLGPKRSTFFDRGVTKKKILLVSTRKDPDKGLRFILPIFPAVQKQGWQIVGFGDLAQPELASHFDRHEGRITRERLAELLQSAALLLDTSIYEGLGLTSLEAGLCGVRSVVTRKGGIDSLAEFKDELIFIDDPLDLKAMTNQILNFDLTESESKRQKLVEKANHFSWESNIQKFIQSLDSF